MGKSRTLRVFDANLIFLMGSLLFFTIGFTVQQRELYTGLIITQLAVVLLPPFLYLEIRRMKVRQVLRLNAISLRQGILAALITIFMYPAAVTANLVMLNILTRIGTIDIPQLPTADSPFQYLRLMLIVSILAGICEEVFFRGFILRGYEKLGRRKAILLSAVLFGVFHYNIYNLLGAIVLGLVFAMLVLTTDSLYAGIVGHMVNNGFAVTLGYVFNLLAEMLPAEEMEMAETALGDSLLASLLFFSALGIAGLFVSRYLLRKLKDCSDTDDGHEQSLTEREPDATQSKTNGDMPEQGGGQQELLPGDAQSTTEDREVSAAGAETGQTKKETRVQWWEYFPLTGVIPLFVHVLFIQISMLLGRF